MNDQTKAQILAALVDRGWLAYLRAHHVNVLLAYVVASDDQGEAAIDPARLRSVLGHKVRREIDRAKFDLAAFGFFEKIPSTRPARFRVRIPETVAPARRPVSRRRVGAFAAAGIAIDIDNRWPSEIGRAGAAGRPNG